MFNKIIILIIILLSIDDLYICEVSNKHHKIMALTKQYLKSKPVVKVTFSLPAEAVEKVKKVDLLGDFNQWTVDENYALKKQKDGSFKATFSLEPNREYQFRYLLDGQQWENDWAADKYVISEIGSENSVVIV